MSVFDGHNDTLLRLHLAEADDGAFLEGTGTQQVDLPGIRRGGFGGGLFALFTPNPGAPTGPEGVIRGGDGSWAFPELGPVAPEHAAALTRALLERAHRLAADGAAELVGDAAALDRCRREGRLAIVLHLEGAEAVADGADLASWHAAGIRSIGPVWSRPNAYGHGVPIRFPGSPDVGPGLTAAGVRLVRECNELGMLVDVSHLNAAGFWDVARIASKPFVASHSGVHALCAMTRNLDDDQLRALAASGGLVGIIFHPASTRRDGRDDPATPLAVIAEHARYVADLVGVDHVALGSDFDGAPMPGELAGPAGLPALLAALRDAGFTAEEIDRIAWGNWRRVLGDVWGE